MLLTVHTGDEWKMIILHHIGVVGMKEIMHVKRHRPKPGTQNVLKMLLLFVFLKFSDFLNNPDPPISVPEIH